MQLHEKTLTFLETIETELASEFRQIEHSTLKNQAKMLQAFQNARIGLHHFQTTTGYGYHDLGREAFETVFAQVFKAETALVRQQLVSGTHAIACALLGNLKPNDELIIASDYPYETLLGVLGIEQNTTIRRVISRTAGFTIEIVPLTSNGELDLEALATAITPRTKMVMFQRSCGYTDRPSLSIVKLAAAFKVVKAQNNNSTIFVDNCYGEFVETEEPLEVGADLIAGSLIKNPGGCLAPCGGYIAGRTDLVNGAAERLYAPKIGGEIGPSLINLRLFFQGFFEAPHRVGEMLKGALLTAGLFAKLGQRVAPLPHETRADIIQKIYFDSAEHLIQFCQAVQKNSPIESHVLPEPAEMPGYLHRVIMGGGTFISGATSEFSVDAPLIPPYIAFLQGGLSYTQIKLGLIGICQTSLF